MINIRRIEEYSVLIAIFLFCCVASSGCVPLVAGAAGGAVGYGVAEGTDDDTKVEKTTTTSSDGTTKTTTVKETDD